MNGTIFPVTVTKGNVAIEVSEYGYRGTSPIVQYQLSQTDGTKINENERLTEDTININISITNIKDLKSITSITLKDPKGMAVEEGITLDLTAGTITAPITQNGTYTVSIVAQNETGNDVTKNENIIITRKLKKTANMPEYWDLADDLNTSNDWYAYKDESGNIATVNEPKLADGMTAIKYIGGAEDSESTLETLTSGSKWANAMTKDGSMWVWIPRYAYRIPSGYHKSGDDINPEDGTLGAGTIEIAFLKDDTNEFLDSNITGTILTSGITDETCEDDTKWILEPAFTFGDEELTGFWFAKFMASNINNLPGNDKELTLQIKPNVDMWVKITSSNAFAVCRELTINTKYSKYFNSVENVDTHMTKNLEWGAVAYLAHSNYGLNLQEIGINYRQCKTGQCNGNNNYNTIQGIIASTTKNVYGIYDMAGTTEFVAACYIGNTNLITSNNDTTYIDKYIDVYDGYSKKKYGDAAWEISSSSAYKSNSAWFKDRSTFLYSALPLLTRGGYGDSYFEAGLFSFYMQVGGAYGGLGFRPVLAVR